MVFTKWVPTKLSHVVAHFAYTLYDTRYIFVRISVTILTRYIICSYFRHDTLSALTFDTIQYLLLLSTRYIICSYFRNDTLSAPTFDTIHYLLLLSTRYLICSYFRHDTLSALTVDSVFDSILQMTNYAGSNNARELQVCIHRT